MGHRHMTNQFMISGHGQHDNNHSPAEWSCIPMGRAAGTDNGPFVAPMDHMLRSGVHHNSHWDLGGRSNEHHSPYVNMEVHRPPPPPPPPFPWPATDPYTHSSANGNASLAPMGPVGHIHSSHHSVSGIGDITSASRGSFKRKNPGISEFGHVGSSSSFYGPGNSSSSQMLIEKPSVDHISFPPYNRGSSLLIDGQDSTRRVRSRSRLELEPCMTRNHVPSYASHYYQPAAHPASYSAPIHHPFNLSADVASREWNYAPYASSSHGRTSPPDINGLRYETSQNYAEGTRASSVDINACHRESFLRRNSVSSFQHPQVSHPNGHVFQSGVSPLYWNAPPSYCNFMHGGTSSTNELEFPFGSFSSGYQTHTSAGGWDNGYRNRRPRIAVDVTDSLNGLNHETMTADHFLDVMLDVDSMSYEELLALEERIGDVNTGLSEDGMSKCLREHMYCSRYQNHEEASCPICLEEYKNGEKVGRLKKCGHEYHVDCIKKWLLMKKVCPICKSECSSQ